LYSSSQASIIDRIYAEIPEEDKRKIWAGNVVEFPKLGV